MPKVRLIIALILLTCYAFYLSPQKALIICVAIVLSWFGFKYFSKRHTVDSGKVNRRKNALATAKPFLAKYTDIWTNLKLSNPYCYITLRDAMTIRGTEKVEAGNSYRSFKVIKSNVHDWDELWNMICLNFSHNKTYDGVIEDFRRYNVVIDEQIMEPAPKPNNMSE